MDLHCHKHGNVQMKLSTAWLVLYHAARYECPTRRHEIAGYKMFFFPRRKYFPGNLPDIINSVTQIAPRALKQSDVTVLKIFLHLKCYSIYSAMYENK